LDVRPTLKSDAHENINQCVEYVIKICDSKVRIFVLLTAEVPGFTNSHSTTEGLINMLFSGLNVHARLLKKPAEHHRGRNSEN